jgi:GDP-D-mannose 3',5'-epimerase
MRPGPRQGQAVAVVTGAAGFIGSHLARALRANGVYVRGADWRTPEFFAPEDLCDEFSLADLRCPEACRALIAPGADYVFHLAADMGGMGFIASNHAAIFHNNMLMDVHVLEACRAAGVGRVIYASSACVYPEHLQTEEACRGLREGDAWPARPQDAYGLEKLAAEELCRHYAGDFGMDVRVVRLHNVYGPYGAWTGGREKAPAALCRKVCASEGEVEIWGDGEQTRSFLYVGEAVEGLVRVADAREPTPVLNLGSEEMVSVKELVETIAAIARKRVRVAEVPGPQGVRGRNSDNALLRATLGWEPRLPLREGLRRLYPWVAEQVERATKQAERAAAPGALTTSAQLRPQPPAPLLRCHSLSR